MQRDITRIRRAGDLEPIYGAVQRSTTDSVLIYELSESLDFDGLALIPTRSIDCFDRDFDGREFYEAAINMWPNGNVEDTFSAKISCCISDDLIYLASIGEVVAVHVEATEPDICYVGAVSKIEDTQFSLLRISSRGEPIEPLVISISEVTKIEARTRYLRAVAYASEMLLRRNL